MGEPQLKSLMDISAVPWRLIQQCCILEQNFGILNVCLASPSLDQIIKGNSVGKTLSITGEKVFRVLMENSYLGENDVRNCLNSNFSDLQRFVGSTWVYGDTSLFSSLMQPMRFRSTTEITNFIRIANDEKQKWQLFALKDFTIESKWCKTGEKYDEFRKAVFIFIKTFGHFLLRVSLWDEFDGHGMKRVYENLLQQLPRVEYFSSVVYLKDKDYYPLFSTFNVQSDRLHDHGRNHSLNFLHTINSPCPFLEEVGTQCETWCLEVKNLTQISPQVLRPNICRNLKILQLHILDEAWTWRLPKRGFQPFMDADLTNFANIVTLIFKGDSQNINWLALLEKFPRVKTIEFAGGNRGRPHEKTRVLPQDVTFPTVTKLILDVYPARLPLPLDRIPQLLPSLVQLTIKSNYSKTELAAQLLKGITENKVFQQQNQIIDVYRVYGEYRSILDSNIWGFMHNLSRIIVKTAEYRRRIDGTVDPAGVVRTEIFARP